MGQVRTRLLALTAVAGLALLTACTDPAPGDADATGSPSDTSTAESSTAEPEPSTGATEGTSGETTEPAQPPVFATSASANEVGARICVPDAFGEELSYLTVLTAIDEIRITDATLSSDSGIEAYEILDAFVLPFGTGAGTTLAPFPPEDPDGDREDASGYVLAAGETINVGIGVVASGPEPIELSLTVTYEGADGTADSVSPSSGLTLADTCDA